MSRSCVVDSGTIVVGAVSGASVLVFVMIASGGQVGAPSLVV